MAAYQRALDTDERCIDAINALERLYRRTQAWDRLVDVLAKKSHVVDDTEQAIQLRLQVGELWEERLGDNDRAVDAYKEVLSVDPQNLAGAERARARSTRRPGGWRSTSRTSSTSSRSSPPEEERVAHLPEDGGGLGGEVLQARSRRRGAGEDPPHRRAQRQGVPRSRAALSAGAEVGVSWSTPTASTSAVDRPTTERIDLYTQMGQVYEQELRDLDRAIESYNDVLSFEGEHPDALAGLARLYEETEQWDRAVEMMRRLIQREQRPGRQKVDLNYRLGQHLRRADEGAGDRRGVPGRGALARSGARAVDAVAARHSTSGAATG